MGLAGALALTLAPGATLDVAAQTRTTRDTVKRGECLVAY
jgi:hypothetical protein